MKVNKKYWIPCLTRTVPMRDPVFIRTTPTTVRIMNDEVEYDGDDVLDSVLGGKAGEDACSTLPWVSCAKNQAASRSLTPSIHAASKPKVMMVSTTETTVLVLPVYTQTARKASSIDEDTAIHPSASRSP